MISVRKVTLRMVAARLVGMVVLKPVLHVHSQQLAQTMIKPPWPGKPFKLACSEGTSQKTCALLGSAEGLKTGCFEPERDTQEVLNSFLIHCDGCLYVDIGCNVGYFAAHAAALGASVDCYEPTPNYVSAIKVTRKLNGVSGEAWRVHLAAVMADDDFHGRNYTFRSAYPPCGMFVGGGPWTVPAISIRHALAGRHVKLLKIDIDSVEGLIFHKVVGMIMKNETFVETIIIEMGDDKSGKEQVCAKYPPDRRFLRGRKVRKYCGSPSRPRGGDVKDFWLLQHKYDYDVYRVNIATGREIYNWTGDNANLKMVPQRKGVLPMFSVRMMRKLEKVLPSASFAEYTELFHYGTSFLVTREQLVELNSHHTGDLEPAGLTLLGINAGSPALR